MAGGKYDSSLTRVQPFFRALIDADPSGASWLGELLGATGRAAVLGPQATDPGHLLETVTKPSPSGRLGCFEYPVDPPRSLLAWFVENPDRLEWPRAAKFSPETTSLREALVKNEPPGSRAQAQAQARKLAKTRPTGAREWWRFEGTSMIDCVLVTDKLVVTIEGKRTEPLSAATDWYPRRSQLVRNLEAAKQLAEGRAWASMLISEKPIPEGGEAALAAVLPDSAPHLSAAERDELHAHYLGNLTWEAACEATGIIPYASLPKTTDDV